MWTMATRMTEISMSSRVPSIWH